MVARDIEAIDSTAAQTIPRAAAIAELVDQKQRCAREFGEAKRRGEDLAPLKARMQAITRQLDALEAESKQALAAGETIAAAAASPVLSPVVATDTSVAIDLADVSISLLRDGQVSDPRWSAFVAAHPRATAYHDPRWLDVIRACFALETYVLLASQTDRVVGGLPLVRQRSRLFGDFLTSLPFVNYGGPLAVTANVEEQLLREAGQLAARLGCRHVESRDAQARSGWPTRTDKISMRLQLPSSADALSTAIGSKLRAQIKRPEREGTQVSHGGAELVGVFYEVFARNMRDLGTPVLPKRWFDIIATTFRDETQLVVVRLGKRAVAAGWLHQHRDVVEIPWASTVRDFNRLGVNMQLYWHCLCWAIERGAREFDFGRSSVDAGTQRFKAQWGAQPQPLHWHYWLPDGAELPRLNPSNARYRLLIAAWQRLPVAVSRALGPAIIRHLP